MPKRTKYCGLCILVVICLIRMDFRAQDRGIDSLKNCLENYTETDTSHIKLLNALSNAYRIQGNYGEAFKYAELSKTRAEKILLLPRETQILTTSKKFLNIAVLYTGNAHMSRGNYTEALQTFFKALKSAEDLGDSILVSGIYLSIGNVFVYQDNFKAGLDYFFKSLAIKKKKNDLKGIAACYNNIGFTYISLEKYEEALVWHTQSLELSKSFNDKMGMAYAASNIGNSYDYLNDFDKALNYHFIALKLREEMASPQSIAASYLNIGRIYHRKGETAEADSYINKGLKMALSMRNLEFTGQAYESLFENEKKKRNFAKAFEYYKLSVMYHDSLINKEVTKNAVIAEMNYEFEKKEATAKIEQDKKDAIAFKEREKQKITIFSICAALLVAGIFAVYAYLSFRQKQRKYIEISRQKQIIEEKQKEILDSIYYARRIQRALLTSEKYINKNLNRLLNE